MKWVRKLTCSRAGTRVVTQGLAGATQSRNAVGSQNYRGDMARDVSPQAPACDAPPAAETHPMLQVQTGGCKEPCGHTAARDGGSRVTVMHCSSSNKGVHRKAIGEHRLAVLHPAQMLHVLQKLI